MLSYIFKRSLYAVFSAFIATVLVFSLLKMIPGDPIRAMATPATKQEDIERLRVKWGFNQPLPVQYIRWLTRTIQGDLGDSVRMRVPVSQVLWPRYLNTLRLTVLSMLIAVVVGVSVGVAASISRGSKFDTITMIFFCSSIPIIFKGRRVPQPYSRMHSTSLPLAGTLQR